MIIMIFIEKYKTEVLPIRCGQAVLPNRCWSKTIGYVVCDENPLLLWLLLLWLLLRNTKRKFYQIDAVKQFYRSGAGPKQRIRFMHLADIMWLQQL